MHRLTHSRTERERVDAIIKSMEEVGIDPATSKKWMHEHKRVWRVPLRICLFEGCLNEATSKYCSEHKPSQDSYYAKRQWIKNKVI